MSRIRYVVDRPVVEVGALHKIPRGWVDMDQVRADLTIRNGVYWKAVGNGQPVPKGVEAYTELFREVGESVYVPRHYNAPMKDTMGEVVDLRYPRAKAVEVSTSVEWRDDVQFGAAEALVADEDDKIISLACGKGKTVVSLAAASMGRRFPALIVVNSEALLEQWMKEIRKHTDIKDSEIGHVQAGTERWRGKKVAVAMLHSLALKKYPPEFYKYWRLGIFDEVHRLGATMFSKACALLPCERWGLSATVSRSDGMDKVVRLHFGRVVYENLEQDLKPEFHFIQTEMTVEIGKFMRRGQIRLPELTTWLCEHDTRNAIITSWIDRAVKDGRTVLVLGERLRQLSDLCESSAATSKGVFVGAMEKAEREAALKKQVVFATQHLAREGLDRPEFDTLFVLVPFGGAARLQQSVGRILRAREGKKQPKVIVFEDNIGIVKALGRKMRRWCREQGFKVSDVTRSK
jgi:superfamily II DNA or RNA helicase